MKKIRIGFVGVGGMGQVAHLKNYATIEGCEVVALAELRPQTAERVAAKYAVGKVYRDHREMLEAEELDGLVASQMFENHAALLPELYPRTRYLMTEKPLALSVEAGAHFEGHSRRLTEEVSFPSMAKSTDAEVTQKEGSGTTADVGSRDATKLVAEAKKRVEK